MPAVARRRAPQTISESNGPWSSVETTLDPFDSGPDKLVDASNVYAPDIEQGSGFYARPGMNLLNGGTQLTGNASPFRGQGTITHTDLSNVTYNFVFFGGKMYREDATFTTATDVSPVGITIDPAVATRVYGTSFANTLVVTDGVNRPWLATNLSSTPITGTYIDYDSGGTTWSAFGPFRLYAGSFFCILNQVNNVQRRTDISWSNPGDASTGWQQTNFDFNWTLGQTEADPLTAIYGTNDGLYYFRETSIGKIVGIPGPNLQNSHTDDSVSKNIGTLAPQSLVGYGTLLYFTDAIGRPYRIVPGADPEPIWLQMRGIVNTQTVGFSGVTRNVTAAAFEFTTNTYIVAIWSPIPAQSCPAVEGYIFDMRTGKYFGRFSIADGIQIETLGAFVDSNGRHTMVALGSIAAPTSSSVAASGYVWGIKALEALGEFCTTEDGVFSVTEDGVLCTTEGTSASNWLDNATVPEIYVITPRFAYAIDKVVTVDRVTALVGNTAPVSVSVVTASQALTLEGTPTPSTVQDSISRLTVGVDGIQGRGATVKLQPTTAPSQWSVQRVQVQGVQNISPPDEP